MAQNGRLPTVRIAAMASHCPAGNVTPPAVAPSVNNDPSMITEKKTTIISLENR